MKIAKILVIAGSDSGGGAGIQADIKTITALGGYASTAITALTAQNSRKVYEVLDTPVEFIEKQIDVVLCDIGADAIKIGMLSNKEIIEVTSKILNNYSNIPVITDPVMVATSGSKLLDYKAIDSLKEKIIRNSLIVTPNIPEAQILSDVKIDNIDDMKKAARIIKNIGVNNVLIKSGHSNSDKIEDFLLCEDGSEHIFCSKKIITKNLHGTGCSLASAIACYIAKGFDIIEAVKKAHDYIYQIILNSKDLQIGHENGSLMHMEKEKWN